MALGLGIVMAMLLTFGFGGRGLAQTPPGGDWRFEHAATGIYNVVAKDRYFGDAAAQADVLRQAKEMVAKWPDSAESWYLLGLVQTYPRPGGQSWDVQVNPATTNAALAAFDKCLALSPSRFQSRFYDELYMPRFRALHQATLQAMALYARNQPDSALAYLKRAGARGYMPPTEAEYFEGMLRGLPPNAVVITEGLNHFCGLTYTQRVKGLRPDVWLLSYALFEGEHFAKYLAKVPSANGKLLPKQPRAGTYDEKGMRSFAKGSTTIDYKDAKGKRLGTMPLTLVPTVDSTRIRAADELCLAFARNLAFARPLYLHAANGRLEEAMFSGYVVDFGLWHEVRPAAQPFAENHIVEGAGSDSVLSALRLGVLPAALSVALATDTFVRRTVGQYRYQYLHTAFAYAPTRPELARALLAQMDEKFPKATWPELLWVADVRAEVYRRMADDQQDKQVGTGK